MITLVDITKENWRECANLSVSQEQKGFIASNLYSLAESKFERDMRPLGVSDGGRLVGFAMTGRDPQEKKNWIIRFMIDQAHQRKGYGKAAMGALLIRLSVEYPASDTRLCVEPQNAVAIRFYEKFGFRPTGEMWEGELVFERKSVSA